MVSAHEIDGHVTPLAEVEEFFDPLVLRRRGPAYRNFRMDVLERPRGRSVKLEILLASSPPEGAEVRFVPYLEWPGRDFLCSVASYGTRHQLVDEFRPCVVAFRRSDVRPIVKNRRRSGRERFGHETELDEGLHSD